MLETFGGEIRLSHHKLAKYFKLEASGLLVEYYVLTFGFGTFGLRAGERNMDSKEAVVLWRGGCLWARLGRGLLIRSYILPCSDSTAQVGTPSAVFCTRDLLQLLTEKISER